MDRLTLAGTGLQYFHICAFFNSRDDEYGVLGPYYKEGADQGEMNLHIVNSQLKEDHLARLAEAGIDVPHCQACGQLEVLGWEQAYLDDVGAFDKERMLAAIDQLAGPGRKFPRVRIMGNMDWVSDSVPGASKLIEFEAEVNEVLERHRQPAICVYDVSRLTGAMMMDLLRTHPLTLVNGVVQENPYFTPPAEMLKELRERGQAAA